MSYSSVRPAAPECKSASWVCRVEWRGLQCQPPAVTLGFFSLVTAAAASVAGCVLWGQNASLRPGDWAGWPAGRGVSSNRYWVMLT